MNSLDQIRTTELSPQNIIEQYSLETSKLDFAQAVRANIKNPEEFTALKRTILEKLGDSTSSHNFAKISGYPALIECFSAHFYIASSIHADVQKEQWWTAFMLSAFYANPDLRVKPIVMPIDDYYSFSHATIGLPHKTRQLSDALIEDGRMNTDRDILILTDVSRSVVFTEETMRDVPYQDASHGRERLSAGARSLFSENTSIRVALDQLILLNPGREADCRLALCCGLLDACGQSWQSLWYERFPKGDGLRLGIIAPEYFHRAMNRFNFALGHAIKDYSYRAAMHQERPIFDTIDGEFVHSFPLDSINDLASHPTTSEIFISRTGDIRFE